MNSKTRTRIVVLSFFTAVAIPVYVAAQAKHHQYKVVDVGTLGGPNSFHSGFAQILNNEGAFVAYADTPTPNPNPGCSIPFGNPPDCFVEHPVVLRDGVVTELDVLPGGMNSQTIWISRSGLIAGFSENSFIDPGTGLPEGRAVLWTKDGQVNDLGTVPGGNESLATAVNSRAKPWVFPTTTYPIRFP
jgi:uncharacterized membrane protein